MSDQNRRAQADAVEAHEENEVAELLKLGGPRPQIPAADRAQIETAARAEWQRLVSRQRERRRFAARPAAIWLGAAAAALIAAALGLRLWQPPTPAASVQTVALASVEIVRGEAWRSGGSRGPDETPRPLAPRGALVAGDGLETGASGSVALRLASGASLRLDAESRVRLISASRVALDRGAVYVDSGGQDAVGAITIDTVYATVVEIGTQFEVRLTEATEEPLRVRVREGEIELRDDGQLTSARAGEELGLATDGSVRRAPLTPYDESWSWVVAVAPNLEIEGRTLSAFLDWVERETGWTVELEGDGLAAAAGSIRLHGSIAGLSPEQAVSVVLPGSGLDYRLAAGTLTVERARPR